MKKISWTIRLEDGVKQEIRVEIKSSKLRWQKKRADEDNWVYDFVPVKEEWDVLEDIVRRRAGRGRNVELVKKIHKLRLNAGLP